jgi:hypothetical protein
MTLHDYLIEAYPKLSWYQRDQAFAERCGTSRQNIGRYRTYKRFPSPGMIVVIRDRSGGVVTADDHLPPALQAAYSDEAA